MQKATTNMTTGNYRKIIINFAFPILLSQLFQQLYNSIDSLIVGNYLGETALAAVSSSGSLIFLFVGFFIGVSSGAGHSVIPMVVMLGIWCIFRITYVTIAMQINHWIVLVFLAYPITWSLSSIIYIIYYFKSNWVMGFEK